MHDWRTQKQIIDVANLGLKQQRERIADLEAQRDALLEALEEVVERLTEVQVDMLIHDPRPLIARARREEA